MHKLHKGRGEPNEEYYQRIRSNRIARAERSIEKAVARAARKQAKLKGDLLKLYGELMRVTYQGELASVREGVG